MSLLQSVASMSFFPRCLWLVSIIFQFLCSATPVLSLPTSLGSATPDQSRPDARCAPQSQLADLAARGIITDLSLDLGQTVAISIAGATFVSICILVFVCCFRVRKKVKEEDMRPLPPAERPPWARDN
ncbi:hypothetical protein B0H17DRAFT_1331859 [Mycena rosella]|uniref:Uncharacterized protein n=1 Tax=Mycena rosella TaxID=1033263 RepID=A0AAD7GDB6_MYCRO|nr:hypothetical protein B0H17DRAFT_1331859 [Mycena rosella]